MVEKSGKLFQRISPERMYHMNCLCNLFDDPTIWLIIIALILLFGLCGNGTLGAGDSNNGHCGRGCGYGV